MGGLFHHGFHRIDRFDRLGGIAEFFPDAVQRPERGDPAVPHAGDQILRRAVGELLRRRGDGLLLVQDGGGVFLLFDLLQQKFAAEGDVFVPLFLFEPLAYLASGLAGLDDCEPVAAGPFAGIGGEDLADLSVLQRVVDGDHPPVDFGSDHAVADGRVDGIGQIDGVGAGRQADDVSLGSEHVDVVVEEIELHVVDEVVRVGILLRFHQAADPGELLVVGRHAALQAVFVLPVGRHAVFRHIVHIPGADLHFEGDPFAADDGGVERLIHVGLGRADIVLEAAGDRPVHVVDQTEDVVAVGLGVHDDAQRVQIVNIVEHPVLFEQLPVDAVYVLFPAFHLAGDLFGLQDLGDAVLDRGEEVVVGLPAFQTVQDLLVSDGIQIAEAAVFHLVLDHHDAEPVGDGGVDLHGLQGVFAPAAFPHTLQGPHVVQTVGQLDHDHADVSRHGQEHLPEVLHLLLFLGGVLDIVEFRQPVHQHGGLGTDLALQILQSQGRILHRVVEQGGVDGFGVHGHVGHQFGHRQRVDDIRLAGFPLLVAVRFRCDSKGFPDVCLFGGLPVFQIFRYDAVDIRSKAFHEDPRASFSSNAA